MEKVENEGRLGTLGQNRSAGSASVFIHAMLFQKIKNPFLEAVKATLGDAYTNNMDNIYRLTIDFVISTVIEGFALLRVVSAGSAWQILLREYMVFNTRTGGGGAKNAHPSGFSRIAEKRRRAAPPFFQYLLTIEFDTLCKNFSPRSPKVRSPGQVKVKNGFLTLKLRSGHTRYPIGFKPSAFHKVIDTYNLYISDFLYLSPEVRSISVTSPL